MIAPATVATLTDTATAMLEWLEQHGTVFRDDPPESFLLHMRACRQAVSAVRHAEEAGPSQTQVDQEEFPDGQQDHRDSASEDLDAEMTPRGQPEAATPTGEESPGSPLLAETRQMAEAVAAGARQRSRSRGRA